MKIQTFNDLDREERKKLKKEESVNHAGDDLLGNGNGWGGFEDHFLGLGALVRSPRAISSAVDEMDVVTIEYYRTSHERLEVEHVPVIF